MNLKPIARAAERVPPLVIDAGLALFLGTVGAAPLLSRRSPFEDRAFPPGISELPPPPFLSPGSGFPPKGVGGGGGPIFFHETDTLTYILLALCAASLLLRRRYPLLTLAGATIFAAIYLSRGEQPFSVQLIVLVAVYGAVADSGLSRIQAIGTAMACGAALGLALLYADLPRQNANWAMDAAWVAAAIFLGDSVRSRRAYALEAERGREEEGRRRASEQRLQIAQELHDVVGHNVSLITVQAGAGLHVLYNDPPRAKEAFANIRRASHETMQELRSMVGVLRDPVTGVQQTMPIQRLDAFDSLIKALTDAGQQVELSISGRRPDIPSVVDVSAYRILQEALTNAVRHAPRSRVHVAIDYAPDSVSLEVTNTRAAQPAQDSAGGGHGLVGMRERVAAIGGRIEIGPQADGGFRVKAVLPFD